jgi:predicted benzoate:H+ symporter BenE
MKTNSNRDAITYGAVAAIAIFFVGWTTGMGGSLLPNIIFSIAMGVLAAVLFTLVKKYGKPKD